MIRAKGEIVEKLEAAKDVTEPIYHEIVDSVLASYMTEGKTISQISDAEMRAFADRLKGYWKDISGNTKRKTKTQVRKVSRKMRK